MPPADNTTPLTFSVCAPGLNVVVPKFIVPNLVPAPPVNVAIDAPVVNVTLNAFSIDPLAVLPYVYVLATEASAWNPPVPVHVKFVAVAT